jgi:hypothetical protein
MRALACSVSPFMKASSIINNSVQLRRIPGGDYAAHPFLWFFLWVSKERTYIIEIKENP